MKITCLIDSLGSGGAQRQLVNLAVGFKERGHQVRFLTYYPDDFYVSTLREHGIEYVCNEVKRPIPRILKFRHELRCGDQDAVLAFLETPALLAELAAFPSKRWKLVVGERNTIPDIKKAKQFLPRLGHYFADYVVANSAAATRTLKDSFPLLIRRILTIYNVIDLERFSLACSSVTPRSSVRTIVVAASYIPRKNLKGLLAAIMLLDEKNKKRLRVEWYGDHQFEYYEKCRELIITHKINEVINLNRATKNIAEVMQQADAVGLFSFQEGLPNAICEGLASGKPIITSDIADAKVLVNEGGNGWLCDPHAPQAIAKALTHFLEAEDSQLVLMGMRSRKKAEQIFNREAILDQYLELLK